MKVLIVDDEKPARDRLRQLVDDSDGHDVVGEAANGEQALAEADAKGVNAKAVTPFLLGRIFELTEGRSLTANIALVRNNAALAAEIAIAMGE